MCKLFQLVADDFQPLGFQMSALQFHDELLARRRSAALTKLNASTSTFVSTPSGLRCVDPRKNTGQQDLFWFFHREVVKPARVFLKRFVSTNHPTGIQSKHTPPAIPPPAIPSANMNGGVKRVRFFQNPSESLETPNLSPR